MTDAVSALYVRADGPYPWLVVDWWDGRSGRDARLYDGPNPVVAHPPCARWGNFAWAGRKVGKAPGEDDGCFAAALRAVLRWGGVLEHPAHSRAWDAFGLPRPDGVDRWVEPPWDDCYRPWTWRDPRWWSAEVRQRDHGHAAQKATWLLYVGNRVPGELRWDEPPGPSLEPLPAPQPDLLPGLPRGAKTVEWMGHREREETPEAFARLLVGLAAACRVPEPHPRSPLPRGMLGI